MTNFLSPAAWNGVGITSFLIIACTAFVIALVRGWVVPGFVHRELLSQRDRELTAAQERSVKDGEAIAKFADAAARSTVAAEVQQAMVTAMRQIAEERTP